MRSLPGIHEYRYWSSLNPHLTHEVLLQPAKFSVWCTLRAGIVRPVFLTQKDMSSPVILSLLTEEERLYAWFQEDSVTAGFV
jgi:hypothetical protein